MTTISERIQTECVCKVEWRDAVGTFDTVTKEWLPDKKVKHVRLLVNTSCPIHFRYQHKTTPEEFWKKQEELGNA